MELVDRVRRTIRQHRLAAPETRVVAALSGGSDSVALVHLLAELHEAGDLRLVGLAHFNHQLRSAADADESFCADIAERLGLPLSIGREDVRALARHSRRSLEDAARTARHAFFGRALTQQGGDVMALGHTRDDQAETFLLRLMRGAGARGLASMHPRNGIVIRPVLDSRRAELEGYLRHRGLDFVTDESNADVRIPRNRVRLELLPLLATRFNPSIVDVLANQAAMARDEHEHLATTAQAWLAQHGGLDAQQGRLLVAPLVDAPPAVGRAVVYHVLTSLAAGRSVGFDDVERTLELARRGGKAFDAPGQRVKRIGGEVVLTGRPVGSSGRPASGRDETCPFAYALCIPGEVHLAQVGVTVTAELAGAWNGPVDPPDAASAVVQLAEMPAALAVRNRRPGDRFQPLGLGGRKKLQDFLVDRKVARSVRDEVPIVVDAADRIIWVAGHAIDESFRVKDPAQSVIILRLKAVGGPV